MLKAISLYTGVGGLDFGLEAAGFKTAVSVELDPVACRSIRRNRDWPVLEGDIHGITSREILARANLRAGEAAILIGGPPCQPFSKSSYWVNGDAARLDDPRADTLAAFLRVLRDTRPRVFLLENVHGLAYKGKDEGLGTLLKGISTVNRAAKTNYSVSWKVLNAVEYGVPQSRERVFLIGSRDGRPFSFPAPTHGPADNGSLEPFRTAWDAIGDLDVDSWPEELNPTGKWAALLPSIPEGQNYLWHTPRSKGGQPLFGWRTRYWSFLLKLAKDKPSWTIQAEPGPATGPFHWRSRKLSIRELCRLQTFSDNYEIEGTYRSAYRQVGNAVPCALGELLGLEVRRQFLAQRVRRNLRLIPTQREHCPLPEQPTKVPRRYFVLRGAHRDHPGARQGPGVRYKNGAKGQAL